jgi:DNA-binding LacI/PurR family transcriptional regulator
MSVSQKHIAEALDVSIITVSRALRNHPDMAETTRQRVWQKARELGYRKLEEPVEVATKRVGVLLYEGEGPRKEVPLDSGIKRHIFLELQRECQRNQVETMIETPTLDQPPLVVRNGTVQAAFLFGRYTEESVAFLRDIPVLAVSSFIECEGVPRIVAHNLQGMREATEHLIGLGHRRILFIEQTDPHTCLHSERSHGYMVAMYSHGLKPEIVGVDIGGITLDLIQGYRAVVCSSDTLGLELKEKIEAQGGRVPDDCSIVAFDNLAPDRALTTYAPDWALMGRLAASLLIAQPEAIRGRNIITTVPGKLLLRNSARPA